jgi:hypothetical protein
VVKLSLIDPSRITPRDWLIIGIVLVVAFWAWHEFYVKPSRLLDEVCERADVIELDKTEQDARMALDEMKAICGDRKPIDE